MQYRVRIRQHDGHSREELIEANTPTEAMVIFRALLGQSSQPNSTEDLTVSVCAESAVAW